MRVFKLILALLFGITVAACVTQSVWAAEGAPMDDKIDISNVTAQIVWSKQSSLKLVAHYDPQSKLYWALPWSDNPASLDPRQKYMGFPEMTFKEAQSFVKDLVVDGQSGWVLPSIGNVMRSNASYSRRTDNGMYWVTMGENYEFARNIYYSFSSNESSTNCQPYYQGSGRQYVGGAACDRRVDSTECRCYNGDGELPFIPVRSRSIYDDIIEAPDKTPGKKLDEVAKLLLEKKLAIYLPAPQVPTRPQTIIANSLDKGEFETTEAYQKRTDAENERVRSANEAAYRSYMIALEKYDAALAAQPRELMELKQRTRKPEALSAALANAMSLAMTMVHGDPVLTDLKYDADKQIFSGNLKGGKSGFGVPIEFAVPLSKAAQVKEAIGDSRQIPNVIFDVKALSMKLVDIKIVDDTAKQQMDFANAKKANTVEAYENFIKLYPGSPQSNQAKKMIGDLQASALAQERERQRSAAQAEQQAKNEERNFGMLGRCTIGSTVYHRERWDTTTSSGNIIADAVFGAATKEKFIIVFEGVVEGFAGDKVKVLINDYRVQQTKGGGFLSRKTYQGESLGLYADKYLGKTQYYPRNRCL